MEQIDAYCDQIALEEADDDSDENYTKAYKAHIRTAWVMCSTRRKDV
jgi:hypothetical protein